MRKISNKISFVVVLFFVLLLYFFPLEVMAKDTKKFIVVGDASAPPFSFYNEKGEAIGFSVDIFEAMMKDLKIDYDLELKPFHIALQEVSEGKADAIIGMPYDYVFKDFSKDFPQLYVNKAFYVRKKTLYKSDTDLKGKPIIVVKGLAADFLLRNEDFTDSIIEVESALEGFRLLVSGENAAFYGNSVVASYYLEKSFGVKNIYKNEIFRKINSSQVSSAYGPSVLSCRKNLADSLKNAFLNIYTKDFGTKIYEKWFTPKDLKKEAKERLYMVLFCFFIVVLLFIFLQLYTRAQVKKALRELKGRDTFFKELLDRIPISIAVFNPKKQNYFFMNESYNDKRFRSDTMTTKEYLSLFTEEDLKKSVDDNNQVYKTGIPLFNVEKIHLKDDTELITKTGRIRLEHNNHKYVVVTRENIKDLVLAEEKAHEAQKVAEKASEEAKKARIIAETSELEAEKAKNEADRANKLKTEFLANVSHDIRNPISAIVGFSSLLNETDNERDRNEYFSIIQENNELLQNMFKSLLDFSRIESGSIKLEKKEFDLSKSIHQSVVIFSQQYLNKEVTFIEDNPFSSCIIIEDKNRLNQVINNFITNAIKFTNKGTITLGYSYRDNGIRVYVQDTGIGISEENQKKVFDRFYKINENSNGTGLGMAICQGIIEIMNGKIGVISKEGEGSCFWFWWPCEAKRMLK